MTILDWLTVAFVAIGLLFIGSLTYVVFWFVRAAGLVDEHHCMED